MPKQFTDFFQALPKLKFDTIFDVGANLGQSSLAFRMAVPQARIHAFEPVSQTFEEFSQIVAADTLIHAYKVALGDQRGHSSISAHKTSTMNRVILEGDTSWPGKKIETTEIETGDHFCHSNGIESINFLKIDTEGFDLRVLNGFQDLLKRQQIDLLQVEAGMHCGNTTHVPMTEFIKYLEPLGYFIFGIYNMVLEKNRPLLRRSNIVFVSSTQIDRHRIEPLQ